MKKSIKALTIGTTLFVGLCGGYASGVAVTTDKLADKQIAIAQQQKAQMNQLKTIMIKNNLQNEQMTAIQMDKKTSDIYMGKQKLIGTEDEENIISETFEVTEIMKDGHFRAEKADGTTGEGIYYTVKEFKDMGFNIDYGNIYRVGWNEDDYENENWDEIAVVEQIK
jgi:hypothetical protein